MAIVQIPYNKIIKTNGDWQLVSPSLDKNDCCYLDFSDIPWAMTPAVFTSCPFKDYIIRDSNALAVFLVGSNQTGTTRERSDYDIMVFTNESADVSKPTYKMIYGGHGLHWFYKSAYLLKSVDDVIHLKPLLISYLLSLYYIKPEHLLYVADNDTARTFANNLLKQGKDISLTLCDLYCKWMQQNGRFEAVIKPDFDLSRLSKCSWFKYFAPAIMNNEDIDLGLITRMKSIRYNGLSETDTTVFRTTINSYLANNKIPAKATVTKLEKKIVTLWEELFDTTNKE